MNSEQALELVSQACAKFSGTLQEHQLVQGALQLLETVVKEWRASKEEAAASEGEGEGDKNEG